MVHVDDAIDGWIAWLADPGVGRKSLPSHQNTISPLQGLAIIAMLYAYGKTHNVRRGMGPGWGGAVCEPTQLFASLVTLPSCQPGHGDAARILSRKSGYEHSGQFSLSTGRAWNYAAAAGQLPHTPRQRNLSLLKGRRGSFSEIWIPRTRTNIGEPNNR